MISRAYQKVNGKTVVNNRKTKLQCYFSFYSFAGYVRNEEQKAINRTDGTTALFMRRVDTHFISISFT